MAVTNFQLAVQFIRRKSFLALARKYGMTSAEVQERFRRAVKGRDSGARRREGRVRFPLADRGLVRREASSTLVKRLGETSDPGSPPVKAMAESIAGAKVLTGWPAPRPQDGRWSEMLNYFRWNQPWRRWIVLIAVRLPQQWKITDTITDWLYPDAALITFAED